MKVGLMFKKIKEVIGAAALIGFCSGQFDAFGSDIDSINLEQRPGNQIIASNGPLPGKISEFPPEVMREIFEKTSKIINPRHITSVCKLWYVSMRQNEEPQEQLRYSTMNLFMKKCMTAFWENQLYNGGLCYQRTDLDPVETLLVSNLNVRSLILSEGKEKENLFVITRSMDRFFVVEEENKDKIVVLIVLRHEVAEKINNSHPFFSHMQSWNEDNALGMFWRWGNQKVLHRSGFQSTARVAKPCMPCPLCDMSKVTPGRYAFSARHPRTG
jgi:hypothetical protein